MKPVLDHAKLQGLQAILGDEKCAAALNQFKDELRTCLSAIESDGPDSAESAHRLAGVAGLLGFDDLEDHSRTFLNAVHEGHDDVGALAEELIEAAERAEAALAALD